MSASSASVLAQMATTGASACPFAYSRRRSNSGLFSNPLSLTLATNIAGLAVIRHSGFSTTRSSLLKSMLRTGFVSLRAASHFLSTSTRRCASLSPPALACLVQRAKLFSTVARSARHSSV